MKFRKSIFFVLLLFCSLNFLKSQSFSYGIRGGMLYNFGGILKEVISNTRNIVKDSGSAKMGWQLGGFVRMEVPFLFVQPELVYTDFSRLYNKLEKVNCDSRISRVDFSPLIGINFLAFFRFYVAPVFSFSFINEIDLKSIKISNLDRWKTAFQVGLGADISIITVDLKWERGLSKSENTFALANKHYSLENRPSMLIFSLGFRF